MIRFPARTVTVGACGALLASAAGAAACAAPAGSHSKPQIVGHDKVRLLRSLVVNRRTVRLLYGYPGSAPPADIATVSYRRRTVHITLFQKSLSPGLPDTANFRFVCAEVKLAHRLGRRRIVDGLTGRPAPGIPRDKLGADIDLRHTSCTHPRVQ